MISFKFFICLSLLSFSAIATTSPRTEKAVRTPASWGDYGCLSRDNDQAITDIPLLARILNSSCDKEKSIQILQNRDGTYSGCCVWKK